MKDLSNYTYSDLYDMLTHIDPYKYADRVEAVRKELDSRKKRGEVPEQLIPKFDIRKEDLKMIGKSLGMTLYGLVLSLIGFILVQSLLSDGVFTSYEDYLFAFNALIAIIAIIELKFSGKVKYLKIVLPVYLLVSLVTFVVLFGVDKLALP